MPLMNNGRAFLIKQIPDGYQILIDVIYKQCHPLTTDKRDQIDYISLSYREKGGEKRVFEI